jgi:hypothetical protein
LIKNRFLFLFLSLSLSLFFLCNDWSNIQHTTTTTNTTHIYHNKSPVINELNWIEM